MPIEYAQMLSTACRYHGLNVGYGITHRNHPCNIWARESLSNWLWLKTLAYHTNREWQFRYQHTYDHASWDVTRRLPIPKIKEVGLTPFPICTSGIDLGDPVESYREYYRRDKRHLASWSRRLKPSWWR